jgi:outer membrane protein assembly factor BamB
MKPLLAIGLALVGLISGCAALRATESSAPAPATEERAGAPAKPAAKPAPKPLPAVKRGPLRVRVTVVDGDTLRRVRGATVAIAGKAKRTNREGQARIRLERRGPLLVRISGVGYLPKTLRYPFQRRRNMTIRVYRRALQWTMYGANPARTQAHGEIRLRPPFRVVWSRGLGSLVEFPAVVSEGVAYIANFRGTVHALDMKTGRLAWRYDPPGGKSASSPAIVGATLVVHGMDGYVRVLDRSNGEVLWERRIGSPIESSPVVRGGVDYFGAWNGRVYALDLRSRRLRWTYRSGSKITSSAAIAGRTLYIGDYGGRVAALRLGNGRPRWVRSVNGRVYGTPAVAGGRVFVPSSTGNSLTAFSTGGRSLWRVGTGAYVYSSPALWKGRVFFGSYNGRLYAVAARSGRVLWSVAAGGPVSGAATVVAGVAYAGHTRGGIVGADARSGKVLLRFPHGEYVPVSGNGRRLLLHGYSRVYAVQPRSRG